MTKVIGSKELMKTVGRVMRKLVKWMNEKGYMPEDEFGTTTKIVDELKDELPKVKELSGLYMIISRIMKLMISPK